jgi:hypothetical protein
MKRIYNQVKFFVVFSLLGLLGYLLVNYAENKNEHKFSYQFSTPRNNPVVYSSYYSSIAELERIFHEFELTGNYPSMNIGSKIKVMDICGNEKVRILDTINKEIIKFKAILEDDGVIYKRTGYTYIKFLHPQSH